MTLELAQGLPLRRRIAQLLAHHHYRGFHGLVGENVLYLAQDQRGRELAVMVFGATAWKVAVRDQFIGWSVLGPNNVGTTAVLEALNLLLNPEINIASQAIDENVRHQTVLVRREMDFSSSR